MWRTVLGIVATLGLSALLARHLLEQMRVKREAPARLFGAVQGLLQDPVIVAGAAAGSHKLSGRYRDLPVQVQTVTDTLNVRKLPSLWLMVTIAAPLPVTSTFDLMMRPAGPTTFSNFDHLPVTIERPPDFPEQAVIRTDDPGHLLPPHVVAPHLEPFFGGRAKELLITPNGIRMVFLIGEADRVRYGVFRQAEFGDAVVEANMLTDSLDRLIALRTAIVDWLGKNR